MAPPIRIARELDCRIGEFLRPENDAVGIEAMPTSTSNVFGHVNRRRPCRICWKPDWRSFYVKFHPLFLANLSSILTQLQNHCWKTSISIFLLPFHRRLSQHKQASGRKQRKSGAQERGRGASTTQCDCTRRQRISGVESRG